MKATYMGEPIVGREAEFTLTGSYVDVFDGELYRAAAPVERVLTIRLQPGQSWTRASRMMYRRGQAVRLYINDELFVGRVKYRYREKMVCVGHFTDKSASRSAVADPKSGGDERIRTAE